MDRVALFRLAQWEQDPVDEVRNFSPSNLRDLLQLAEEEKVLMPVGDFLCAHLPPFPADEPAFEQYERRCQIDPQLRGLMHDLGRQFAQRSLPWSVLKGFGVEQEYSTPEYRRQLNDLDLAVPDLNVFWRVGAVLFCAGFSLVGLLLRCDPVDKAWYGVADFLLPSDRHPYGAFAAEVQVGGQPISWLSTSRFDESFWREQRLLCNDPPLQRPHPRHAALILVIEMLDRDEPQLRDLLDLQVLDRQLNAEDLAWVELRVEDLGLQFEYNRLREKLAEITNGRASPRRKLARLPRLCVKHTYPYLRRRYGWLRACRGSAVVLLRELLKQHPDCGLSRVTSRVWGRFLNARRMVEGGLYTRFVYMGPFPQGPLAWDRQRKSVLVTPLGVFNATPFDSPDTELVIES